MVFTLAFVVTACNPVKKGEAENNTANDKKTTSIAQIENTDGESIKKYFEDLDLSSWTKKDTKEEEAGDATTVTTIYTKDNQELTIVDGDMGDYGSYKNCTLKVGEKVSKKMEYTFNRDAFYHNWSETIEDLEGKMKYHKALTVNFTRGDGGVITERKVSYNGGVEEATDKEIGEEDFKKMEYVKSSI